ncbi:MAG TPA: aminotransferase class III-fold pyridoxal phosphate-dependent enzyme [Gammaproteobacteria bacterium]|nr:aminotransferase class III-fold pyridoxal phosphate-dependent enzyme [Gammaproteobacteria bacterium]
MTGTAASNSLIVSAYRQKTGGSAKLAARAREVFPSGIVHDARRLDPYEIYVTRASGARKWDVDGNEYLDYYGGHGALLLGHSHPVVVEAVTRQLERGTHYAACHELEVQWGELIKSLVPCAERVRFTSSGTEANLMAFRLARAFTGKTKLVRFAGHFHGWQDHAAFGYDSHFDGSPSPGVLKEIADNVLLAPADDVDATTKLLEERDDIAAVILEPTGASFGLQPVAPSLLTALRIITKKRGIVLIFDEVVTGFRVAPGGAQSYYGVTPDIATFAKVVAGGLPGAAVTGKKELLDLLDFDQAAAKGFEKISHHGTFNANPASAAAGIAALGFIRDNGACETASRQAAKLRGLLNALFSELGVAWAAYGEHSAVYVYTNPDGDDLDPRTFDALEYPVEKLKGMKKGDLVRKLRLALLLNGVDVSSKPGGLTSCVHGDADLEQTADAFRRALIMLRDEGEIDKAAA